MGLDPSHGRTGDSTVRPEEGAAKNSPPPLADDRTTRVLSAAWDTCNMSRQRLQEPARSEQADRLSQEILQTLGIWRDGGIDRALQSGAERVLYGLPKNVRNIASRAIETRALLSEQRGDEERAYTLSKFATQISTAAPEVLMTLLRLTEISLPKCHAAESAKRQEYALEVLKRSLESAFEIRGNSVPDRLIGTKSALRDRALWTLHETARFSLARGLAIAFGPQSEADPVPHLEMAARCAENVLSLFRLPTDFTALQAQIMRATAAHPAKSLYVPENIAVFSSALQIAGEALQQRRDPISAAAALSAAVWVDPTNTAAREALRLLQHTAPPVFEAAPAAPMRAVPPAPVPSPSQRAASSQPPWLSDINLEMPWDLLRVAPPENYGWDLDRRAKDRLFEARIKLGFERANALLPESVLRETALDLMLIEKLPHAYVANFVRFAEGVVDRGAQTPAAFIELLRLESCLQFAAQLPGLETQTRSQAASLQHKCETTARKLHKGVGLGDAHGPVLQVFRVLNEHRTAQRKKN